MMKELIDTLKKIANKRREISLIEIRKYDSEYGQAMDKAVELRDQIQL